MLMIVPSYVHLGQGQTFTSPTATNQCLDFDGDGTCEYIILANGTQVANPLQAEKSTGTSKAQGTNFLPYDSPALGVSIQHPIGWNMEIDDDELDFIQLKDIVNFEVNVDNEAAKLSDYVNARINFLREERPEFSLIESSPTTISGNIPAHKVLYTFVKDDNDPRAGEVNKVMRIWAVKDAKLYTVAYISEIDNFDTYLPLADKMVDSFRISPAIQKTSTSSSDSNNDNRNNERNNDNNQKNWRDDPNCWYYETFVCNEKGECDNDNFDCITDCEDGSSVTTGFSCPGESDEGVPDDGDDEGGNPYCDLVPDDYTGDCHDRKDFSEDTGLYTCRDGSHVEDWQDCDDAGSHPDEQDSNCGGEPCTDTEKEDSTLDDETEYVDETGEEENDEGEEEDEAEETDEEDSLYGN